jgi:hypothetical protein
MYVFLSAHGIDPKRVGFKHNMLAQKYHNLYAIFSGGRIKEFGYDQSEAGHDEQILAFLMAYRKNNRGPVMSSFVRRYLPYARKNEKRLRSRFFGLHSTKTVPMDYRSRISRIFRSELKDLV